MIKQIPFLLLLTLPCRLGHSQENVAYRVLPEEFNADKSTQMMRAYQRAQVRSALDRRLQELEVALESPESIAAYQKKRREFLRRTLGPMPGRTPLNARVTSTIDEGEFLIENLLFESQPGFYVTANLYRPSGQGPYPGVLLPCGHSANGKAYSAYQKACRLLVKNGFVVLCFDPIGQGERRQLIGRDPSSNVPRRGEHNDLGVAPILLGSNLASYMVWDGVRAIDYLCSRTDVDAERIGCTGNSGGGNLTSYLMAYDDRIAAAAPGCFMTTHRRKNESPGPGDAEQNLFAQIRDGFDHADFAIVRAPRPTLILAATKDYVPIEGTWEAFRQAKRVYTSLGFPGRIDLVETNEKHGFSRRLREGVVRNFARLLQGREIEVFEEPEEEVRVLSDATLRVTPQGQVLWMDKSRSLLDLFEERAEELAKTRPQSSRQLVREVTGVRSLDELSAPNVDSTSGISREGLSPVRSSSTDGRTNSADSLPRRLVFHPEPGIVLPALWWPGGEKTPVLLAPDEGMNTALPDAQTRHSAGHPVLIVDVRDVGETSTRNWRFYGADFQIGQMLGRNWLAMRTEDLLVCARWLAESEQSDAVSLSAYGEIGPSAVHAAFLEPNLIAGLDVEGGLSSWRELMGQRQAGRHIHQAVRGALRFYDLPDLRAAIQPPLSVKSHQD